MGQGLEARNVIDYSTLTVSSSVVSLADASPTLTAGHTVKRAIISVETDSVRFREDGTSPTATEGHLLNAGDVLHYMDANYETTLNNLKFIRVSGTDAQLKITYYD